MRVRFVEEAQREFLDGISYYEEARGGLGQRFKDEVDHCVLWVADPQDLFLLRPGAFRRINLRVFPYYNRSLNFMELKANEQDWPTSESRLSNGWNGEQPNKPRGRWYHGDFKDLKYALVGPARRKAVELLNLN